MAHIIEHFETTTPRGPEDPVEFGKLIAKLRWIGAHDQADRLQDILTRTAPHGFISLPPGDTD